MYIRLGNELVNMDNVDKVRPEGVKTIIINKASGMSIIRNYKDQRERDEAFEDIDKQLRPSAYISEYSPLIPKEEKPCTEKSTDKEPSVPNVGMSTSSMKETVKADSNEGNQSL